MGRGALVIGGQVRLGAVAGVGWVAGRGCGGSRGVGYVGDESGVAAELPRKGDRLLLVAWLLPVPMGLRCRCVWGDGGFSALVLVVSLAGGPYGRRSGAAHSRRCSR